VPMQATAAIRRAVLGAACAIGVGAATAASAAAPPPPPPPPEPRHLLIDVRDTPPSRDAPSGRGADGSFSVSTGDSPDAGDRAGNGTTLATNSTLRHVRVTEGERIRVDLPSVQSLQFHVPIAPGRGTASAPGVTSAGGAAAGAGASGVVYFEGVSAFAARFFVDGKRVTVELIPLRLGSIEAPFVPVTNGPSGSVLTGGLLGQWLPLGDAGGQAPGRALTETADAPSPASVWVRVSLDTDQEPAGR